MSVLGPYAKCPKCGKSLSIQGDGRIPVHDVKGTKIPCLGSLERPK